MSWLWSPGAINRNRVLRAFLALLGPWVFACPAVVHAEWPQQSCSLRYRLPVTITASSGGHGVETRIDLVSTDFPATYTLSPAGADVRVFQDDDVTPVDYVIAGWDPAARTATIYVRTPFIPTGASRTLFIYFGDENLAAGDTPNVVFPDAGVRLRSRVSLADPVSAADGLAAFAAAATDVSDMVHTSVSGLNNRALGGANGDFGWCVSAVLNITPATAGNWSFRYGGDFGRGGHLYVRGQALEEQWNDDLWWAGNFNNTNETLEGAITLPPGWHRFEALGFEGCCDGGVGFQARAPGGAWQDLSSSNFALRGAQCINESVTVAVGAAAGCSTTLTASKSVTIDSSSPFQLATPGAIMRYEIAVSNPGQAVDAASIVLTDVFPSDVALVVTGADAFAFSDAPTTSGLTFTYGGPEDTTDSVEFSTDGVDFSYIPSTPSDSTVTHIRFRPTGTFNPNNAGAIPAFTITILGEVR